MEDRMRNLINSYREKGYNYMNHVFLSEQNKENIVAEYAAGHYLLNVGFSPVLIPRDGGKRLFLLTKEFLDGETLDKFQDFVYDCGEALDANPRPVIHL